MNVPIICAICRKPSGDGVSIFGKLICSECEKTMVNLDINDGGYDEYKDLIKKNIYGDIILKQSSK